MSKIKLKELGKFSLMVQHMPTMCERSRVQSSDSQKQNRMLHPTCEESSLECAFKSLPVSTKKLEMDTALGTWIWSRDFFPIQCVEVHALLLLQAIACLGRRVSCCLCGSYFPEATRCSPGMAHRGHGRGETEALGQKHRLHVSAPPRVP